MQRRIVTLVASTVLLLGVHSKAADTRDLLAQIKSVGREGQGNVAASKAFKELVQQGPDSLTPVLAALDDASPRAANWLRSAAEVIADRAFTSGKLSASQLEDFVLDTKHSGAGRRFAFEWLGKVDPAAPARLLPGMLNDPGQELRREAVELKIEEAQKLLDKSDKSAALAAFQKCLEAARDRDQVKLVAERLGKLGVPVDLTTQFGYVTTWALVGPFDNVKGVGFTTPTPPEKGVDLKAEYVGKDAKPVQWITHTTTLPLGMVDLNKLYKQVKGEEAERLLEATVVGYTVVESKEQRPVEIRATSNNAVRIWLNGKEIFFRDEYHHGTEMDQHVGKGTLKAGRNEMMIKVCQNQQTEPWAQQFSFQLRVCDALGAAVPVTVVTGKQ